MNILGRCHAIFAWAHLKDNVFNVYQVTILTMRMFAKLAQLDAYPAEM
jgi:hypothetical protein